ncbi:MAG: hypothetical protein U0930_26280 [Pirellulales bacterium]
MFSRVRPEQMVQYSASYAKKSRSKKNEPQLRSYTGEALIPLMDGAEYIDREAWDANSLDSEQEGDLSLDQWQISWPPSFSLRQADGRRWLRGTALIVRVGQYVGIDRFWSS